MISEICRKIAAGEFEFSRHAVDQSILRRVSAQGLQEAMVFGELLEDYPDDKYAPSCLVFGYTQAHRPLHIQCGYPARTWLKLITLFVD